MNYRIISVFLIVTFLALGVSPTAFATQNSSLGVPSNFVQEVMSSTYFQNHANEVKSIYANRVTDTPDGIRYTLAYNLSEVDGEITLIFVGDESNTILFAGLTTPNPDGKTLTNLIDNVSEDFSRNAPQSVDSDESTTRIYGYDSNCTTYRCTQTKTDYTAFFQCNTIVGMACSAALPNLVLYAVCRAGVVVLCYSEINKVCTAGYYAPVCEM